MKRGTGQNWSEYPQFSPCRVNSPSGDWVCSRIKGHKRQHIAYLGDYDPDFSSEDPIRPEILEEWD